MGVIHTADQRMKKVLEVADQVATSKANILIFGESGTGKELLAQYIHSRSQRSGKEMFALNCAAVPEGLLESELFGYEKGAFTGADTRKAGKFEMASGGSFLLDEISELPLLLQSKLLRVLQEGEVQRLGASRPTQVDVRILAASNVRLIEKVKSGEFREDLFYRLNVIPLEIPPLRERPQDIRMLSQMFLDMTCEKNGLQNKSLSEKAKAKLMAWDWPGNIRELQNVMERSALLSSESQLTDDLIQIEGFQKRAKPDFEVGMTVSEAEKLLIMKTLEHTSQNRTKAAHILGISIRTLRNKLNEYRKESGHERVLR